MTEKTDQEQYTLKEYCLACLAITVIPVVCVGLTAITMYWVAQQIGWVITLILFLVGPSLVRFTGRKLLAWERRQIEQIETRVELKALLGQLGELNAVTDMPRRVEVCKQSLDLVTRETNETLWAKLQVELGNSLMNNPLGNHAQNVELALAAYQNALQIITKQAMPVEWAMIMANVGNAYHERASGDYEANQAMALQAYENAQEIITRVTDPSKWALLRSNVANLYLMLPEGKHGENVESAIQALTDSLSILEMLGAVTETADTLMNLGNAYMKRVYGNPIENVEIAISYYERALALREPYSHSWAETLGNLGMAHRSRGTDNGEANIEKAIQHFELASEIITSETDPLRWATIQSNLADALFNRVAGDQTENVEKAINILKTITKIPYLSQLPEDWVDVHTNLASAYRERRRGNRASNIEMAIDMYIQSLSICEEYNLSMKRTIVWMNLGAAFLDRLIGDPIQNIELAKKAFTDVLQELDPKDFPVQWSLAANNLANVYANQQHGNRMENMATAIDFYEQSLAIRSRERSPYEWAQTMVNYAMTLEKADEKDALYGEKAIKSLLLALEVFQKSLFPREFELAQTKLGDVYFNSGNWQNAVKHFQEAQLVRDELVLRSSVTDSRIIELGKLGNIASASAYALAKLEQFEEAIVGLEQNLAWLLRNSLIFTDALLDELVPHDREKLRRYLQKIKQLETQAHAAVEVGAQKFSDIATELRELHFELTELIDSIRKYLPGFMTQSIEYADIIHNVTTIGRPIVYLLTTEHGSLALIVLPQSPKVLPVWINEFNEKELDNILEDQAEQMGYLHGAIGAEVDALINVLDQFWDQLGLEIMCPIAEALVKRGYKQAVLIPLGFLRLLPFHAFYLDELIFTMAPSVSTLHSALEWVKVKASKPPVMLAVGNPGLGSQKSLPFAQLEVEQIKSLWPYAIQTFFADQATKQNVIAETSHITHLHLACHGLFDPLQPLESIIQLTGNDFLTVREIIEGSVDMPSMRLVILSACQTGTSDFHLTRDEAIGFPLAFMQMNVPGIISTLWSVTDISTMLLMEYFYRIYLQNGTDIADALCQAQLWLRGVTAEELANRLGQERMKSKDNRLALAEASDYWRRFAAMEPEERPFSHPYYWAAFTFTGA
jgi:CHAT domain-containing protein